MNKHEQNFIKSILAAVIGQSPPANIDWEQIYKLARFHMVQNILAENLLKCDDVPEKIAESLADEQTMLLIKDANQLSETDALIKLFEESKIPVVMLKGWYLKNFYPRSDLRAMADTDMYIRESDQSEINEIIKKRGYTVVTYGGKKDNVYNKEPFSILEMHKNLFMYEDKWNELFNNKDSQMYIWKRSVKVEEFEYIYRMDDELFFVYMIAHIAKHLLDDGGIGVKAILDIWLFLKHKKELDFDIVSRDLEKLGLKVFSENVVLLCQLWFENKEDVDLKVRELGDHILSCGVYGNSRVMVATKDGIFAEENSGRFKYLLKRAFPAFESMKTRYPQLNKKKWLLPIFYFKRLWYSLVYRGSEVKNEINSAKNIDYENVKKIQSLYENIGLR